LDDTHAANRIRAFALQKGFGVVNEAKESTKYFLSRMNEGASLLAMSRDSYGIEALDPVKSLNCKLTHSNLLLHRV
jgi:hypothetical protein